LLLAAKCFTYSPQFKNSNKDLQRRQNQ